MDVDALTLPHMAHGEADCTAKVLNVREEPSLQAKVIGSLRAGQRVIVWQVEGVWWRVETPTGLFGWAHSGSLKPVKELVRVTLSTDGFAYCRGGGHDCACGA